MYLQFTYGATRYLNKALISVSLIIAAPAAADQTHILALGDSLTQGYGLLEQDGFVPQLRAWMAERGHDVRIVNGGVSGDTSAGGLARAEWSLTPEIEAMIVTLGGNDLLRGLDPAATRANIEGILEVADAKDITVLLVGMQAPGNYGPEFKEEFDALYPELAQAHGTLFFESFFAGLLAETDGSLVGAKAFMQPDGIHPNKTGVEKIVNAMGPSVEALVERAEK